MQVLPQVSFAQTNQNANSMVDVQILHGNGLKLGLLMMALLILVLHNRHRVTTQIIWHLTIGFIIGVSTVELLWKRSIHFVRHMVKDGKFIVHGETEEDTNQLHTVQGTLLTA